LALLLVVGGWLAGLGKRMRLAARRI
jgi:hypothetical protein